MGNGDHGYCSPHDIYEESSFILILYFEEMVSAYLNIPAPTDGCLKVVLAFNYGPFMGVYMQGLDECHSDLLAKVTVTQPCMTTLCPYYIG